MSAQSAFASQVCVPAVHSSTPALDDVAADDEAAGEEVAWEEEEAGAEEELAWEDVALEDEAAGAEDAPGPEDAEAVLVPGADVARADDEETGRADDACCSDEEGSTRDVDAPWLLADPPDDDRHGLPEDELEPPPPGPVQAATRNSKDTRIKLGASRMEPHGMRKGRW